MAFLSLTVHVNAFTFAIDLPLFLSQTKASFKLEEPPETRRFGVSPQEEQEQEGEQQQQQLHAKTTTTTK